MRKLFTFLFALLAVIVGFISITLISLRYQALSSETYTEVLRQNGVYKIMADGIDLYLDDYFQRAADPAEPSEEQADDFGPKLSELMLRTLLENIDLQTTLQLTVETNLENIFNWINGRDELYFYFPKQQIIDGFGGDKANDVFIDQFVTAALDGVSLCQAGQTPPDLTNPEGISEITCYTEEFKTQLRAKIVELLPLAAAGEQGNVADSAYQTILGEFDERTPAAEFLEQTQRGQGNETFQAQLTEVPRRVKMVTLYMWLAVVMFVALTMLATLISRTPLKAFSKTMMLTGALVLLVSALTRYLLIPVVILERLNLNLSKIDAEVISALNLSSDQLSSIINSILVDLGLQLTALSFSIGLIMFVVFNIIWLLTILLARRKQSKAKKSTLVDAADDRTE